MTNNNYIEKIKLLVLMLFNNACLCYDTCIEDCPLKCGFGGSRLRCFFDSTESQDGGALSFSEDVFLDKGKKPPTILEFVTERTCGGDAECYNCSWHVNNHCKMFNELQYRVKWGGV